MKGAVVKTKLAHGLGGSPGVATGVIAFRGEEALALVSKGIAVILVRIEASSDDSDALRAASGLVTTRGGLTGDGAIIARCLGKPCIVGCATMRVDYAHDTLSGTAEDGSPFSLKTGDTITIDGASGDIFAGRET